MRIDVWTATAVCLLLGCLGATAPRHVSTADYFAGYEGTHRVPPAVAARYLTWAETDIRGSQAIRPYGVKTLLYTDPNRQIAGEPLYTPDESTFAHDCTGERIATERDGQYLMDPRSPAMTRLWRAHVHRYEAEGHFDAIFDDDADDIAYVRGVPCRYQSADWLDATVRSMRALGMPIVYNGLSNLERRPVSPSIALNAAAIGGMMEECYARSPERPTTGGDAWTAAERTELLMAAAHKLFFCYGNDTTPADRALGARLYVAASFLLTYDPGTSVLWEYYGGASGFHVMPESGFVPLQPLRAPPASVDALRTAGGAYVRAYRACYLDGRPAGACAVAVNPDDRPCVVNLHGYRKSLRLNGGGVLDGGRVSIASVAPPPVLAPHTAAIAVR